jgi:hypothetical protein
VLAGEAVWDGALVLMANGVLWTIPMMMDDQRWSSAAAALAILRTAGRS